MIKHLENFFKLSFFACLSLAAYTALAQAAAPAPLDQVPQLLQIGLGILSGIPAVGPYLAKLVSIMGMVTVGLTFVVAVLDALKALCQGLGKLSWLSGLQKVADLLAKVRPYVAFLSAYNVQKK